MQGLKKALFFSVVSLVFVLSGCREPERSLFVSLIQEPPALSNPAHVKRLLLFSKRTRVKTIFVQVYRSGELWHPENPSEDTLFFLIREAHADGIKVHAWFNLLSLSANDRAPILNKYGPEVLTRNPDEKRSIEDYKVDNQYFLEPGDERVKETLVSAVEEILAVYTGLDGIQFDYIRYPDWHPVYGYTPANVERFKKETGKTPDEGDPAWKNWKRDRVTDLLMTLAAKARSVHPGIQVSVTGLMPYSRAYHEALQDWKTWLEKGVVDFVTLMCYTKDTAQFEKYILDAKNQVGAHGRAPLQKVNIAVGAYQFTGSSEDFRRQFKICKDSAARGCAVLHYGSLLEDPELADVLG